MNKLTFKQWVASLKSAVRCLTTPVHPAPHVTRCFISAQLALTVHATFKVPGPRSGARKLPVGAAVGQGSAGGAGAGGQGPHVGQQPGSSDEPLPFGMDAGQGTLSLPALAAKSYIIGSKAATILFLLALCD